MSADQTPGRPTEQEWAEVLAVAMWRREYRVAHDLSHEPAEVRDGFKDDAEAVLHDLALLIARVEATARAEGAASVAGPVLAVVEEWAPRGFLADAPHLIAKIRAVIPTEAVEALARLKAEA